MSTGNVNSSCLLPITPMLLRLQPLSNLNTARSHLIGIKKTTASQQNNTSSVM